MAKRAKRKTVHDQFYSLSQKDQLAALSKALLECADRSKQNMLIADSWIEESFRDAALRLDSMYWMVEMRECLAATFADATDPNKQRYWALSGREK